MAYLRLSGEAFPFFCRSIGALVHVLAYRKLFEARHKTGRKLPQPMPAIKIIVIDFFAKNLSFDLKRDRERLEKTGFKYYDLLLMYSSCPSNHLESKAYRQTQD